MENVNKQLLNALAGYDNIVRIVLNGLRRDYEERGLMIRKEFHDELSSAHAKACDAVFDAKQKMKAIAAAEEAQQDEPRCACGDSFTSDAVCANCLAAAEPVALDVMALANEVREAVIAEITKDNIISITGAVIKRAKRIDLVAIVDRYATQPPAVAVPEFRYLTDDELWQIRNHVAINEVTRDDDSKAMCVKHGRAVIRAMLAAAPQGAVPAQAAAIPDELTCEDIERLRLALSWEGYSTPESLESCAARWPSLVRDLIAGVLDRKKRTQAAAQKGSQ